MRRYTDYDDFAHVYNRHWGGFATQVIPILEQLALKDCPPPAAILDLCCGTGQLAQALIQRGYKVNGVDSSEQMLRYARINAPDAAFCAADARSFELPVAFDIAISSYDSLNHLLTLDDVETVFRKVAQHLETDGIFVFDMNLDAGFRGRWVGSFHIRSKDSAVLIESSYDEEDKLANMNITIFMQDEQDESRWRRSDLTLTQRAYSIEDLTSALASAGFVDIQAFDARRDLGMRDEGRAFFRARKP